MLGLLSRGISKVIHDLDGVKKMVSPLELATRLGACAFFITGMLKQLVQGGGVDYEPWCGTRLIIAGTAKVHRVIHCHRLVELFLVHVLSLDGSEAEAEVLEPTISPQLEQASTSNFEEPLEVPHGHPLLTPEDDLTRRDLRPLPSL